MSKKVFEITDLKTLMPVKGTAEYNSESKAIEEAGKLGLSEGKDYMITWYMK